MEDFRNEYCMHTATCGQLRATDVNQEVTLCGWAWHTRDHGGLIFIDLRDRDGYTQVVVDPDCVSEEDFHAAEHLGREYVLKVSGRVRERAPEAINPNMITGEIEVLANAVQVLNTSVTPPFSIEDGIETDEITRMKWRYLDIRRPEMLANLKLRHTVTQAMRRALDERGFLEIETPILANSTPEGARDYIVPSRIHNGKFYALPQSPQMYKQLLMIAGMDRYIQLARCFRDEDLRADRQPEFTQIDLEMSFVDVDDILECLEGFVKHLYKTVLNVDIPTPLPRLTYDEAMTRYGSDKPDTRFGMEITDISDIVKDCGFSVFKDAVANGGSVRGIVAKGAAAKLTRKEIDKQTEFVRGIGAKGLAYVRWVDDAPNCSFAKFMGEGELEAILKALGCEKGDVALIVADKDKVTLPVLGALRLKIAKQLDIIPEGWNFLWIVEFPFFEYDEESGEWLAMHHPFTMPLDECIPYLDTDKARVRAKCYDLVLNGIELSSGSIRITDPELQQHMFEMLGMTDEEINAKFGFLVDAYKYGAPPHGGAGIGLDRLAMLMCGCDSLRDVTAFPKVQNASELMSEAPSTVSEEQLKELGIAITNSEE